MANSGQRKVVAAALQTYSAGTELIVYVEPHEAGDVLESKASRFEQRELEDRAETLKQILLEKGWKEIGVTLAP